METENEKPATRRTYEPPQMRTIELAAEEVLAVGCKLASGGFAFGSTPCTLNNCSQPGS